MFLPPPPSVIVHILHDNTLTPENRDKFNYIAGRYNQQVKFYNVEILCADRISKIKKLFSDLENSIYNVATFYRLFCADVLDLEIEKIIYLDSDTVVNLDIKKLWQIELNDKILAAVSEKESSDIPNGNYIALCKDNVISYDKYFNTGVLLINLKLLRTEISVINEGIKFIAQNAQYTYHDQDVLNYCFSERRLKLPVDFNKFVVHSRRLGDYRTDNRICHYISTSLGIGVTLDMKDFFSKLWLKYFMKTPFFNEDTIGNLYGGMQQLYIQQKNFARQVSALISGKTRSFFVPPNSLEAVKQIFYVQPNEEIILADSPASLQTLINSMQKFKGKKIYFLLLPNEFSQVQEILIRAGFSPSKDFLNVMEFLSDAEGVPLNSYSLLKLL